MDVESIYLPSSLVSFFATDENVAVVKKRSIYGLFYVRGGLKLFTDNETISRAQSYINRKIRTLTPNVIAARIGETFLIARVKEEIPGIISYGHLPFKRVAENEYKLDPYAKPEYILFDDKGTGWEETPGVTYLKLLRRGGRRHRSYDQLLLVRIDGVLVKNMLVQKARGVYEWEKVKFRIALSADENKPFREFVLDFAR